MMRSVFRTVLSTLALALLFASSFNLSRTSAQEIAISGSHCAEWGCPIGGPVLCAQVIMPDGTIITCGMP